MLASECGCWRASGNERVGCPEGVGSSAGARTEVDLEGTTEGVTMEVAIMGTEGVSSEEEWD